MKSNRINPILLSISIIVLSALLIQSCTKTPTTSFTYQPSTNPEAGDSIKFTNTSLDATSYSWDFGDTYSSTDEHPSKIYVEAGPYTVTLTASNEKKSDMISEVITINEPTELGVTALEDDGVTPIEDVSVWVYDNEYDFQNYNDPQYQSFTDADGFTKFQNLEAQVYIVDFYKETDLGEWGGYVTLPALELNKMISWDITLIYTADEVKKSSGRSIETRNHPLVKRKTIK